ncbi:MAG: LysE family transporter [Alphaproteobacteria bacterium]
MLEEISVFYRGIVLGLAIAAPIGPVGLLCIRRSLQKGMVIGLATGLGAACADTIFGAIAVLGVSAILAFIHRYEASLHILGGAIVLFGAWHTWRNPPRPPHPKEIITKLLNMPREETLMGTLRAAVSGFVITMINPLTLFGTLAVVATFGGITEGLEADVLVAGIFSGSVLWWCLLSGGVSLMRHHFTESRIVTVNHVTAIVLAILAGWAILSGIHGYMG